MMEAVFFKVLNMSITASYLVLAVIVVRWLLKKAPKFISVILWGLVAVRLVCPFSIESILSLVPSAETVSQDIVYSQTPQIHSGISSVNTVVNDLVMPQFYPNAAYSANPLQIVSFVASQIWLLGIVCMVLYTIASYIRIYLKVREAVKVDGNIYECDRVESPFILGVIRPRIYLPSDMNDSDREYVIAHEKAHIKRRDHLWKPIGFLLLSVYWFNPVLWVAYILLCCDIEFACDEKVIKAMGEESKKSYSDALINFSAPRKMITACPVAFGETGVKGRIKSVLNYKKPAFWVIIIAVILSIAVAVFFMTNPKNNTLDKIENSGLPDNPKGAYLSIDNGADNSYYKYTDIDDELIKRLKEIEISRFPISKDRSEERDRSNTIVLVNDNGPSIWSHIDGVFICFNSDFTEVWVYDMVKPTLSYKIIEPDSTKNLFNNFADKINTTNYPSVEDTNTQSGSECDGVSISIKQINLTDQNPYIEVEFTNLSEQERTFGLDFELYYKQDDKYISCVLPTNDPNHMRLIHDIAVILKAKGVVTQKFYTAWFDLSKEGIYKFEIEVGGGKVWTEFELKKTTNNTNNNTIDDGHIQYYSKPANENETPQIAKQLLFSSDDFNKFVELLQNKKWTDDRKVDRLAFDFNGRVAISDKWLYFGYEQGILYYDTYFCVADNEILDIITKQENVGLVYGTIEEQLEDLKSEYSEFFDLDTTLGLELYVSEFASGYYKCQLFSVMDYNFAHSDFDIRTERGATLEQMKIILSSYNIQSDKLYVMPYRNPLSNYYYAIDDKYNENLKLLFGSTAHSPYKPQKATITTLDTKDMCFNATILRTYDNEFLMVAPFDTEEEYYKISDIIVVDIKNVKKHLKTSFKEGDKIYISYSDNIKETYPVQISAETIFGLEE